MYSFVSPGTWWVTSVYTHIFIYQRGHRGELSFFSERWLMCNVFFVECTLGSRGLRESGSWGAGVLRCRGAEELGRWELGVSIFYISICLSACLSFQLSICLSIYLLMYLSVHFSPTPYILRWEQSRQTDQTYIRHAHIHTYIHAMRPRMNDLSVWSRKPKEDSQAWGSSLDIAWESNDLDQEIWRGPMDAFLAECALMLQERDQQIWIAPVNTHHLPGRFWHLIEIIQRTWGGHFGVARIRHALEAKGHEPKNTEAF